MNEKNMNAALKLYYCQLAQIMGEPEQKSLDLQQKKTKPSRHIYKSVSVCKSIIYTLSKDWEGQSCSESTAFTDINKLQLKVYFVINAFMTKS